MVVAVCTGIGGSVQRTSMTLSSTNAEPVAQTLKHWATAFEPAFAAMLQPHDDVPPRLVEAMRYSALAQGKRVRPFLVTRFCELNGGSFDDALPPAAAIECVHAFSLIHDDLPGMDDDDLRRGQPTNHKKYGEATAILAGDALLALAFELIARHVSAAARAAALVSELARGAGWSGMIGGQMADILGETKPPSREQVEYIHVKKTASLFEIACRMGAIAADADQPAIEVAGRYGHWLGRAFQIADDLLDVTATVGQMGKGIAKDAAAGKQTFPAAVGLEQSRVAARHAVHNAIDVLDAFGQPADDLRALANYVVQRHH